MTSSHFYGCEITPYFFDSRKVEGVSDFVTRVLPFIQNPSSVQVLYTEADKKNFYFGDIVAQPDAVMSQHSHLLSLEYKSLSGSSKKLNDKNRWENQIRLKDVLQAVVNALQVSIVENKPCVTLLRYLNVVYFISPSKQLCDFIIQKAPDAKRFHNENRYVSSTQLCEVIEPLVKKLFQQQTETKAQSDGRTAHDSMLHNTP